jgi:hypothetical protein
MMNTKEELGTKLIELYTRSNFGKLLKAEVDALVFHYLLLERLDKRRLTAGGGINYLALEKDDLYRLSQELGLPQSRLDSLLENDSFLYGNRDDLVPDFLIGLIKRRVLTADTLKTTGKVQLWAANPITRKLLEAQTYLTGGIVDCERNREVLVWNLPDFLRLLDLSYDAQSRKAILALLRAGVKDDGSPETKTFLAELEKPDVSVPALLKTLVTEAASRVAGDRLGGLLTEVGEYVFKSVKESVLKRGNSGRV